MVVHLLLCRVRPRSESADPRLRTVLRLSIFLRLSSFMLVLILADVISVMLILLPPVQSSLELP